MSFRKNFLKVLFASAIALVVAACAARAGNQFQPVSQEELKMKSEPEAQGAAAIILFRQVDRDDSGDRAHEDDYVRIKILTDEGRKYADVEIPFDRADGFEVVNIKARTIRPDGTIVNFDGKVYDKSLVKGKGIKYLAKTFTLPDVQTGGIIEYFYTVNLPENFVYDSHWILSDDLFTKSAKFSLRPYHSNYSNLGLRWTWKGLPPGAPGPKLGPDTVVRLEVHDIPAFQTEDYMPPENELKARVDFIYSADSIQAGADEFWKTMGKRWNASLENFVGKRKAMEEAVGQIVAPADTPEMKLQKIYARVQQVRNTSYEVGKTEQQAKREKEKANNNVEDVWKRNSGNGVQITWLYLGLVRAAGFEAYGVWVPDRRNYFFEPKVMNSNKLDANVVLVKMDGKDLYFDPGAKFTPYGLLPWIETNVPGLRLDKDGGSWVQTPLPPSSASEIQRKADLKLSDAGDLEGKLTVTFTGLEASWRRVDERNADDAERKKFLEDEVKEYVPAACEVELTSKPDWSSSEPPLVAEFNLKVGGWGEMAGHRVLVPVGLFSAREKHLFEQADRVYPIYFAYRYQHMDDVSIDLPLGWQVSILPRPEDQDAHVVSYAMKTERTSGGVHVTRKLDAGIIMLDVEYYPALRRFFQAVKTADEEQIILQAGGAASGN